MPSRSIRVETGKIFFFFKGGYMSMLHFLYPFIHHWKLTLFGSCIHCYKILKSNAVKVLQSIYQQIWKIHQWPQDGEGQFSFQSWRRAVPKNVQTTAQLCSFHMLARLCLKSFKLGFSNKWTENFQDVQLGLEKAEIKLPTFVGS